MIQKGRKTSAEAKSSRKLRISLRNPSAAGYHMSESMEQLLQDARQAARALRHSPGFPMARLLTVALGVGGATAMFTVVNGVVLRPLPYPDAGRIVRVWSAHPERGLPFFSVSPPDAIDWAGQARTLASLGAFERPQPLAWPG